MKTTARKLQFKVNINGSTRDDMIERLSNAKEAFQAFRAAMQAISPHGRDYQTSPTPQKTLREDLAIWRSAMEHLAQVDHVYIEPFENTLIYD